MATLEVHVVTPEREIWGGPAQMVIARGIEGELGILAGHAPVLIRLAIAPLRVQREDGTWEVVVVDGGFLHVTSGDDGSRVDVLADGGELEAEVDRDAARALAERLTEQLSTREGQEELEAELARAKIRADLAAR
jgi:F-type H+-transporting ATPase subunit epsilon